LSQAVFNVVQCGVDEDPSIIPSTRFNSNGFVNKAMLREVLVSDGNGYYQGHEIYIFFPKNLQNILCLLMRATKEESWLQTTYFTGGLLISAIVFCCWMSYKITAVGELRIRQAVPP
jgi:hypothetical protein